MVVGALMSSSASERAVKERRIAEAAEGLKNTNLGGIGHAVITPQQAGYCQFEKPLPIRMAPEVSAMSLQKLFGVQLPIIQAPMAGWQGSELAIAVSDAGGCREIPAAALTRSLAG
jgi:hypothetical protein